MSATDYSGRWPSSGKGAKVDDDAPRVILLRGSDVKPEPIDWLWPGWLAAGKLHLIGGQPGTGKTTIATALAATVTIGGRWPDGSHAARGSVAIWSGEDDAADTLAPRLLVAGADMRRVHLVSGIREKGRRYPFDPANDTALLADALADIPDVRLLVVDPIVSAVSGDSHKNAEVRRGLQPLVDLAQQHHCALLGVTHFTKGTAGREPVERITGSLAFGALPRLIVVAAKQDADKDTPARRVLLRAKSNIGPDGGGFVYDLSQAPLPDTPTIEACRVSWGDALVGNARDLLAEVERHDDEREEQRDAADWLRDVLEPCPMPVKDLKRQADESGFAWRTVQRAMRRAGVESRRGGFGQSATWRLASRATTGTVAPVTPHGEFGANGTTDASEAHICPHCDGEGCPCCRQRTAPSLHAESGDNGGNKP
ncbi:MULTISPECIES: AAA family ATPase [unclassified Pseudoxanthomonas]|uniref:AAA family ATPase n=1 Tax=unclassified Pseudoxanthomonas TaxID=2645906 RepID=UPI0030772845